MVSKSRSVSDLNFLGKQVTHVGTALSLGDIRGLLKEAVEESADACRKMYAADDSITFSIVSNPTNGSLSGEVPNITYEPDSNFSGIDTFAFRVNDGSLDSDIATISITINEVNIIIMCSNITF